MQRRTGQHYQLFPLLLLFLFLFAACGDLEGSGNAPDPEENISDDSASPTGDFGVSLAFGGPYLNDVGEAITSPDDERVIEVEPGSKFYVQVDYEDPSGITDIEVNLVNSNPAGLAGALDPTQGFFTLGQPTNISEPSGCDLSSNPTSVTCVYEIQVADDAVNITALENSGDEFAYVFRTKVTDAAGNTSDEAERGYVTVIGEGDGEPEPQPETCVNPVNIPDEALRRAIREELEPVEDDTITCEDLASLTIITGFGDLLGGISSLEGLQYAINLETISFLTDEDDQDATSISDLSPLANLTKLRVIEIVTEGRTINDISPLRNLVNLVSLELGGNSISDVGALTNLTKLATLGLSNNEIRDLSPLAANEGLAEGDSVSLSLNPLNTCPSSENREDIETLQERGVEVSFDEPENCDDEGEPTPQPETCTNPVDIPDDILQEVIQDELGLAGEDAITCEDLAKLTQIDYQDSYDPIVSLEGLQYATNLELLRLDIIEDGQQHFVSDLSPLAGLRSLETIILINEEIEDLTPLASISSLRTLGLAVDSSDNFDQLATLTTLESLSLPLNNISDLSFLQNLTNLTNLYLGENNISNLVPLQNLGNLERLNLVRNQVDDLSPLVENEGLGEGDTVILNENPLDTCPGREDRKDIDSLLERGVEVEFDKPKDCDTDGGDNRVGFIDVTTTSGAASLEDECTLRAAITAANTDSAVGGCPAGDGADTVVLREGDPYLLTEIDNETEGGNGLPAITSEIKLLGTTGAAIRRDENAPGFRIFYVAEEGNLTVVETAILGGSNSNSSPAGSGIYNAGTLALESDTALRGNAGTIGAGLYNRGEATVRESLVTENVGSALGAGFYNEGTLIMISSEVSSNSDGDATGFYNKGTLTIEASSINNNANINASGAFINTPEGVIEMTRVDIIGNSDDGGTVYNSGEMTLTEVLYDGNSDGIGNLEGGTLTLIGSTVSNVGRTGLTNEGTLNMQNSTVSGNERGGIENSGTLNVAYSTLNNNGFAARNGVGILNDTSEGDAGTVSLVGTIIAGHDTDCEGEINSEGYNLDSDGSCNLSGQGDLSSVDPQLGDLQENGFTLTHPLREGSPAIDAIPTDACEVETDQRGTSRPQGEACDIGAFEVTQ